MSTFVVCECLESRNHFAATPAAGLDADYGVSVGAIRRAAGQNVSIYQAIPAHGERTYLLAERYADVNDTDSTGYLTIFRLNAKGRLDSSFGTGGVALTGRVTQKHDSNERSGLLKVDDVGRLYFADDNRVFRFRADGTTDTSFGTRGVASFASADQQVGLCDITPIDDGVLIATTKTLKGVQYFAVQKVDRHVETVFSATHQTGEKSVNISGKGYLDRQELATDTAQFARSAGGLVLARIETDNTTYLQQRPADADEPGYDTVVGVKEQNVVITRLNSTGHGTDVVRKIMRRRAGYDEAAFGNLWRGSSSFFDNNDVYLSDDARFVLVQSDQEVMRLDLKRDTVQRYSIPAALYANFNPTYQLLGDGKLYASDYVLGRNSERVITLNRFAIDGTPDRSFGRNGVMTLTAPNDVAAAFIKQMFLGASGRLYFLAEGGGNGTTPFAVRRV